jgi:TonB family protein
MIACLVFICLFLTVRTWGSDDQDNTGPEELIARARLEEQVWKKGTPPMLMRAEIQVFEGKRSTQGSYTLNWMSPSRWREEIKVDKYERLRVSDAKGYWQTRAGLSYQPEILFELERLLPLKDPLRIRSNLTLGKIHDRDKDGTRQKCAEVKWATGITDRTMCFDEANGALVSIEYPRRENQNPPQISRIEYGAFNSEAGKLVPHEIRALKDRKVVASVKVVEIAKITDENPALFSAPANAEFWPECDDLQEAVLLTRIQPEYPHNARVNHVQGTVVFYAVLEVDGTLSHLTVIHGAAGELEAAAMEAVRQWRYKPAACGDIPIRMETSIMIDFWLNL